MFKANFMLSMVRGYNLRKTDYDRFGIDFKMLDINGLL